MPYNSLSLAKTLLVLFLLIASTSVYFGKKWTDDSRAQKSALTKMTKEKSDAQAALTELSQVLTPDRKTLPLDTAVSAVLLDIFNLRVASGITVTSIVPGKQGGGGDMRQITSLAEEIPGTSLKTVKVNVEGTYRTYGGLMSYLEALQKGAVAVTRLKVHDQTFEMSLRVYGSMDKR